MPIVEVTLIALLAILALLAVVAAVEPKTKLEAAALVVLVAATDLYKKCKNRLIYIL